MTVENGANYNLNSFTYDQEEEVPSAGAHATPAAVKSKSGEEPKQSSMKKVRKMMKDNYESRSNTMDHRDINSFNALHYACMYGNLACVVSLVEEARIPINNVPTSGYTALHIAARNNRLEICQYLVLQAKPQKADVLIRGLEKDTPKEAAVELQREEIAEFLDYHERRMTMWKNRNCLLKICINRKNTEIFKGISIPVFKEIIKYA